MTGLRFPIISVLLLCLLTASRCCLDSSETAGNCTQCVSTQVLIEGSCYDRLRGCATYRTVNKTLICGSCLFGYVPFGDKCERKAVVDALNGSNQTQSNIPPVFVDNPGNLNLSNITTPNTTAGQVNKTQPKMNNTTKILPIFPELRIITIPFPVNFSKTTVFTPPKKAPALSLPGAVEKLIVTKYPYLLNSKLVQIGNEVDKKNIFLTQDKVWVMYEEGTILLIEKVKKSDVSFGRTERFDQNDYTITELLHNRLIEKQVKKIKSQFLSKIPQNNLISSLAINFNLKLSSNRTITFNLDLSTGQIQCLASSENLQECLEALSKVSEMPKYNQYLKYSYSQFLEKVNVVNLPEIIITAEMYKNELNQMSSDFVFRIVYGGGPSSAEQEYSLFRYNAQKNVTQILGYFIQNNNILNLLKNFTSQTNPSNSTQSPINTTNTTNIKTNATLMQNSTQDFNASDIQKKPVLGSQFGRNVSKLDQTTTKNDSAPFGISNSSQSNFGILKPNISKILQPSKIKTQQDLQSYLLKTKFASNLLTPYRIFSLYNQSAKNWQIYKTKIITTSSVYSLTVTQNLEDNYMEYSQNLDNQYSCITVQNDSVAIKIDQYLKKSYPVISSYGQMITQFQISDDGERYYLVYINQQRRKITFEVTKKKGAPNYVITKYEPHDSGYCFERKSLDNIGLNLSQFNERIFDEGGKYSFLSSYKVVLIELFSKYKSYLTNTNLQAIIANGTNLKVYLTNRFATFQYKGKIQQKTSKGEFMMIEQKYGDHILPLGFKKENLITQGDVDYDTYKSLEDNLIKRYKTYFGGGNLQVFGQKRKDEQSFDIAIKTVMGYFTLVATKVNRESISLSPLVKSNQFQETKTPVCKDNQYLDVNDRKCYQKIVGCYRQIASICIMCESEYIMQGGRKQCRKSCAW